ncbi:hypothetical protein CL634_00815 [bacterium]|nr:hypothetical protein [bacterium]|tara:strand:+ start:3556 stop:4137 length:582 start_codon:yes stop_codon:yes gene_type:complete
MSGKFIVLYGINNLGKSTQAKLLVDYLNKLGKEAIYLKYPIYDLEPTGPKLNSILREGKKVSAQEMQETYAQNRRDYEPQLIQMIKEDKIIVGEDYTGTGLAWGMAHGVSLEVLEEMNKDLLREDLSILLEGDRFMNSQEKNHLHESDNELTKRCRQTHLQLSKKYNWPIINANQSIDQVHQSIVELVNQILS